MTLQELIAAERSAVDHLISHWGVTPSKRKTLYAKMRSFSEAVQRMPLPNDVRIEDATLQLSLRAKDLAGVSPATGFFA